MTIAPLNHGWQVRAKTSSFAEMSGTEKPRWRPVTLPHDAQISEARDPNLKSGAGTAYFPGGNYEYRRTLTLGQGDVGKRTTLVFDGIYRDAMVYINGTIVAHRAYGYSQFEARIDQHLKPGSDNEIRVETRNGHDSRWYSGAGIYREVALVTQNAVHIVHGSLRVRTIACDGELATIEIAASIRNDGPVAKTLRLTSRVSDRDDRKVEGDDTPVTVLPGETVTARHRLYVQEPALWSPDTPSLYVVGLKLRDAEIVADSATTTFGIRTISLDPKRGLRLNDAPLKLRGGCLHHDNGVIGAATIARAEERRIELLKTGGFNAIRSGHSPISAATLDACDRVGMLVMDEFTDVWTSSKSDDDYAARFLQDWERDIESMIARAFNHPSVIFYSIGNEIPEAGSASGAATGLRIAEMVRSLDPDRLITNGVNSLLAVMGELAQSHTAGDDGGEAGINTMMQSMGDELMELASSDLVTERTEETHAVLDVAGLNYAHSRYEQDRDLFPHRLIVGTETMASMIDTIWPLVETNGRVLGDFTWSAWDYLGEVGLGRVLYDGDAGTMGSYPWLTAAVGDFDITGQRRPISHYREIIYGLAQGPFIAVHRPAPDGAESRIGPWSLGDQVASWSWAGHEGRALRIDVFSAAEEVELLLDGQHVAREKVGRDRRCSVTFEAAYRPGTLEAVAFTNGMEVGRNRLVSAEDTLHLMVIADRASLSADCKDLAFIEIALTDHAGIVRLDADRSVRVEVSGAGVLQGLGSANPRNAESFVDDRHTTHDGRLLAVVRPSATGEIKVRVFADGAEPATVTLRATPVGEAVL